MRRFLGESLGWEARIEMPAHMDEVHIWLLKDSGGVRMLYRVEGQPELITSPEPGEYVAPTLRLPREIFAALAELIHEEMPVSNVLERHCLDAIAVRDRLLTMLERGTVLAAA